MTADRRGSRLAPDLWRPRAGRHQGDAPLHVVAALMFHSCGAELLAQPPAAPWCPRCQVEVPGPATARLRLAQSHNREE